MTKFFILQNKCKSIYQAQFCAFLNEIQLNDREMSADYSSTLSHGPGIQMHRFCYELQENMQSCFGNLR